MSYHFKGSNRDQPFLLPPSLKDWLPSSDLAWFLIDAVEQMKLSGFYAKYRSDGKGQAAFEPSMMVTLLLYAYSLGVRSSRKIEQLCERDIGFRVVAVNAVPDHTTIARFRKDHGDALEGLFVEVLKLCGEAGLLKVGVVALDGTKMKADAALESNRSYEHIALEVKKMFTEAAATDASEDRLYGEARRGDELPEGLQDRASRISRLKECKKRLEREASEAVQKHQEKVAVRDAEALATGREKRGRKPQEPDAAPAAEAKANVTDPDSRIMKTRRGYVQGYNGQSVVTEGQIIVAAELTMEENDVRQLRPMIEKARAILTAVCGEKNALVKVVLADAGYCSEANLAAADPDGPEYIMATRKDWKQRQELREAPPPRGRIPMGLSRRERMDRKLRTRRGRALYRKRGQTVEPVFGQIKTIRGCDRFMRRGFSACAQEWKLLCTTHNLLKLWRKAKAA
jgi:transposase